MEGLRDGLDVVIGVGVTVVSVVAVFAVFAALTVSVHVDVVNDRVVVYKEVVHQGLDLSCDFLVILCDPSELH